jgi:Ger(x)C family germination protein
MKKTVRLTSAILILCSVISCLTGCFDRRELDTIGIVMGIAIDKAEKEDEQELTLQFVNPAGASESSSDSSDGGGGGGAKAFINVSNSGKNINQIIRDMQHKISRRIYVPHNQVILFGEELAKKGVRDSLDFFARAPEARMTLNVFVVKGKGSEVLDIEPRFEKLQSTSLSKKLEDQDITSQVPIVTEFEFVSAMISKTTAAVAPLVMILEEGESKRVAIKGSAVFKESVMVGELNEDQTRGMLWVKDKVKTGILRLDINEGTVSMEIRKAKGSVTPVLYDDGTMLFKVNIEMTSGIGDQSGAVNFSDPGMNPVLLEEAKKKVREEIQSAVDKSKELNADIFGFGEYINRKYPAQWKEMKNKWDELYKNINVEITVSAKSDGSGRIMMPLTPAEE